jgi:aryl-alcohol dehydrogenase-like predicted oxidoreductase
MTSRREGHSERLLGALLRRHQAAASTQRLYVATKIPPKNLRWPAKAEYRLEDVYPPDHIRAYTETSLRNLGVDRIDLQQLHVWSDAWADDPRWQRAVEDLKRENLVEAFGISVNRREPANVLRALRTGLVDSVQVVYNIFDQAPEDELFPYCDAHGIAIIARVPFDEGSLTGTLSADSTWPSGDFRNLYFHRENLDATLPRIERLTRLVPPAIDLPELALRFILEHPAVSTTIPGMRKPANVERNAAASDGVRLSPRLLQQLRAERWDRVVDKTP